MKTIVCELCGSTSFKKQDDAYVCNSCGTKFGVEDVKKMMKDVETECQSNIEKASSDFEKYLMLARRASNSGNDADAAKYYGLAQTENPNDWESLFFGVYHTSMQTNIAGIASAAILVVNVIEPAVALIKNNTPVEEQLDAATRLTDAATTIASTLRNGAVNNYNSIDSSIRSKYTDECKARVKSARLISLTAAINLEKAFGDNVQFNSVIGFAYKHAIIMQENDKRFFGSVDINDLLRVAKYDKEFASSRLQTHLKAIEKDIQYHSKKTSENIGLGFFSIIMGIVFIIFQQLARSIWVYVFGALGALVICMGVLSFIPFKKSTKQLAKDSEVIQKLEAQKADIEKALARE